MPNIIIRMDFTGLQIKKYDNLPKFSGWYEKRNRSMVERITMHHTVTEQSGNADTDVNTVLSIHQKKGWGIGYHFLITSEIKNGEAIVAYVGDIDYARAHAIGTLTDNSANYKAIGISIIGDLRTDEILEGQAKSLKKLVDILLTKSPDLPNLVDINKVRPHWKEDPTECPVKWDEIWQIINGYSPKVQGTLPVVPETNWGEEYNKLKDSVSGYKLEIELLQSQLQNKESVINQLTVQVNQLTNATVSNDLYKQLQKENEELTKETQRLKGLINEFESNKVGIASENQSLLGENQKLLEEIAIEKNKSSGLEKNIEDLSNQLAQASTNASTGEKTIMLGFDPLLEWLWGSKIVRGFIKYDTIVVLFTFLSYQVLPFIQSDVFGLFKGENGAYWQGVIALLIGLITKTLLTSYDKNKDGKLDNSDK